MHLPTLVTLACMAVSASAFQYPDFVPLHRRQDPGTPEYECHANCGGVITAARKEGYCDTDTFKTELSDCLNCALKYDIWKYYGSSVSKAATGCGVDATPVEASSTTTTAAASASATETGNSDTLSPSSPSTDTAATQGATSAASSVAPSSSGAVSSTPAASTVVSSATPSQNATGGASPSVSLFPGAASTISHDGLLLSVLAGCLAVAFL
ncbi:hypothetical protein ABOM_001032 [Aspergillus bombycis]|uniref:GPI anchored protein n=1 Tax=Aspergillus bombycis TaxID=109264 RepID=A0A1F8AEL2_9EURO|nr:hypothetical protein ABOM_001032 [Aspergillus bombycis]OGM50164.1 hypothetical protein ABOM_001032 [Aspergillus bombycis]